MHGLPEKVCEPIVTFGTTLVKVCDRLANNTQPTCGSPTVHSNGSTVHGPTIGSPTGHCAGRGENAVAAANWRSPTNIAAKYSKSRR